MIIRRHRRHDWNAYMQNASTSAVSSFRRWLGFTADGGMARPFSRFDRSPLTRVLFAALILFLVMGTLAVSFRIAMHRVIASEHEMDLATECLLTHRYEDALAHYDQALIGFARKRQAWSGRAIALMYLERYDEALESYEKLIRLSPENPSAWHGKGLSLERLGRYDEALSSYDRAIELAPDFSLALRQRGRLIDLQNQIQHQ